MDFGIDPTEEAAVRNYDERIDELIRSAQAGEQARLLLNGDLGREVREHILIRTSELLKQMAECHVNEPDFRQKMEHLQFEYNVINKVSDILALIIMQSEEAIRQFEALQNQR